MDYLNLLKSPLFRNMSTADVREVLDNVQHRIQCYDKEETIFLQMEKADRVGIVLDGQVQAQKTFPNGSMVNVSTRSAGDLIGPAAVFSKNHRYPCDVVASMPATIMMFRKDDLLALMQRDIRILENFTTEISTATYMLQQRIELFSYPGIGLSLMKAIRNVDYTLISGCTLVISLCVLVANFAVDIVYGLLDPRVRAAQTEEG